MKNVADQNALRRRVKVLHDGMDTICSTRRLIGVRNFLTLETDAQNWLWANWWVESEVTPTTKVIHPVQLKQKAIEL
jgi:hypothetical protein